MFVYHTVFTRVGRFEYPLATLRFEFLYHQTPGPQM